MDQKFLNILEDKNSHPRDSRINFDSENPDNSENSENYENSENFENSEYCSWLFKPVPIRCPGGGNFLPGSR